MKRTKRIVCDGSMADKDPKRADVVAITFLDHCEDSDRPIRCTVSGRVLYKRPTYWVVESWIAHMGSGKDRDCNNKRFTILSAIVEKVVKLEPA